MCPVPCSGIRQFTSAHAMKEPEAQDADGRKQPKWGGMFPANDGFLEDYSIKSHARMGMFRRLLYQKRIICC